MLDAAEKEMQTNFMAPLRLIKFLYPIIQANPTPRIVNVTSGLIYAPRADYPFYNAAKSALHAFTQVMRLQQPTNRVAVTEVMFPAVDTPWHNGNPPRSVISPEKAVAEMMKSLRKGNAEIRVGKAKLLYLVSRVAPAFALKKVNSLANE